MTLAISLGNTNLRAIERDDGRTQRRIVLPLDETLPSADFSWADGAGDALVASVHPSALDIVEARLRERGVTVRAVGRELDVPLENRSVEPARVGIDRLLGVLAALRRFPGDGVAVLDFGTAMTINVGSPSGEFLGGWIGVGASTAASALAARAPRLPRVVPDAPRPITADTIPRDTESAIRQGIAQQLAGGVERVIAGLRAALPWRLRVVATGGDAAAIAAELDSVDLVEPDLVTLGILECAPARSRGVGGGDVRGGG